MRNRSGTGATAPFGRPSTKGNGHRPLRQDRLGTRLLAILFWLGIWQALSAAVNQEILLVSPIAALRALARLMGTPAFYAAVALSFGAMLLGFVLAALLGALLAVAAYRFPFVDGLLSPLLSAVKATPVASFIILALVWIGTRYLSVFAAFLMVLPLIYTSVLSGLRSTDAQLLEMAQVFEISLNRRARALYLPAAFPYFLTACQVALGMCWKAGIAAEVIGQSAGTIGDKLYRAKLFLATDELFAWTIAIIVLSVLFEKLALTGMRRLRSVYEGGTAHEA